MTNKLFDKTFIKTLSLLPSGEEGKKLSEEDLVFLSVFALAKYEELFDDGASTAFVRELITPYLPLSGEDKKILKGRTDERFTQVIRNMFTSNQTLVKYGVVSSVTVNGEKRHFLTEKGREWLVLAMSLKTCPINFSELSKEQVNEIAKINATVNNRLDRVLEPEVLVLSLSFIAATGKEGLDTTTLSKEVKLAARLSLEDVAPIPSRPKEMKIDQIVRNLISNNTLEKSGLVKLNKEGKMLITKKGRDVLYQGYLNLVTFPVLELEKKRRLVERQAKEMDVAPKVRKPR